MLARSGEVRAVAGTRDFGQSLRAAADRADLLAERRTPASRLPLATQRTDHSSTIVFPQPLLQRCVWDSIWLHRGRLRQGTVVALSQENRLDPEGV